MITPRRTEPGTLREKRKPPKPRLPGVLPPEVPAGFLEWGAKVTRGVCEGLSKHVVEPRVSGGFSPKEEAHYAGGYLEWAAPTGEREQLWFVVTPAGGDYSVPGAPASLQIASVYENELSADAAERLRSAGFEELKDKRAIACSALPCRWRTLIPHADGGRC